MEMEAARFFSNISREIIIRFLKYSEEYQVKLKKTINHGPNVKPLISSYYNSRVQIDLVDYSSLHDDPVNPPYRFVLNEQDHLTKFCHLPLQSIKEIEVAKHLYKIFCEFRAPLLLQSDNGLEFRNQVVSGLKFLLYVLQILRSKSQNKKI